MLDNECWSAGGCKTHLSVESTKPPLFATFPVISPLALKSLAFSSDSEQVSPLPDSETSCSPVDFATSDPPDDSFTVDRLAAIATKVGLCAGRATTTPTETKSCDYIYARQPEFHNWNSPMALPPVLPLSQQLLSAAKSSTACRTTQGEVVKIGGPVHPRRRSRNSPRSRSGCWTCRIRHKACPENGIPCGTCIRLDLPCDNAALRPAYMVDKRLAAERLTEIRARRGRKRARGRRVCP